MRPLRLDALGDEQRREPDPLYDTTRDARVRTRAQIAQMVLLAAEQGLVAAQRAAIVRRNEGTVRGGRRLLRCEAEGSAGLAGAPGAGAPPPITPAYRAQLLQVVRQRPRSLGRPFSLRTAARLADYLAGATKLRLSAASVRRAPRAGGLPLGRPQHTITGPDPEYALTKRRSRRPATT